MAGHTRIRRLRLPLHRLCWIYLALWHFSHLLGSQGFTPSRFVRHVRNNGRGFSTTRSPRWNNNNGNIPPPPTPPRYRNGGAPSDDDERSSQQHRLMGAGNGAWIWLWNAKESAVGAGAMITGATAATLSPTLASWQLLLATAFVMVQSVGLQVARVLSTSMRQGTAWYLMQLNTSPLITKAVTSAVIGICGDYMAQWLEYRLKGRNHNNTRRTSSNAWNIHGTYDARRGLAILADGLLISGPLMHWGYNIFEHLMPISQGRSIAAMAHVLLDSIILDSVFVGTTIVVTAIVEGYHRTLTKQFQRDYTDTLKASWATSATLIPLEFVCFRYLPVSFRTLAMNLTDIIWDAVISFMAHRNRHEVVGDHLGSEIQLARMEAAAA